MNLSAVFIARPVATTLLSLGVALAGVLSYRMLPVAPLPQVDYPAISVQASLPGASPETMAATVATPLERALGSIAGVNEMTSTSSQGSTRISLQFDLERDINGAARDVHPAVAERIIPREFIGGHRQTRAPGAHVPVHFISRDREDIAAIGDGAVHRIENGAVIPAGISVIQNPHRELLQRRRGGVIPGVNFHKVRRAIRPRHAPAGISIKLVVVIDRIRQVGPGPALLETTGQAHHPIAGWRAIETDFVAIRLAVDVRPTTAPCDTAVEPGRVDTSTDT